MHLCRLSVCVLFIVCVVCRGVGDWVLMWGCRDLFPWASHLISDFHPCFHLEPEAPDLPKSRPIWHPARTRARKRLGLMVCFWKLTSIVRVGCWPGDKMPLWFSTTYVSSPNAHILYRQKLIRRVCRWTKVYSRDIFWYQALMLTLRLV